MIRADDLGGMLAMVPAFATADATDLAATETVATDALAAGLDRMIADGADALATTGSFGEFYALLPGEFETLTRTAIEVVADRVPLFVGVTDLNTRAVAEKIRIAQRFGAKGVLLGIPFYFPSSVENAVRFLRDIGAAFPHVSIMLYHNPDLHRIHLPVDAFNELVKITNLVAMKDSHRTTRGFIELKATVGNAISIFVHARQYVPYAALGASGFWSIDCWMGPAPTLALRDAVARGDSAASIALTREITSVQEGAPADLRWRETALKLAIGYAGYCDPGPLRPPFLEVPESVHAAMRKRADRWRELSERYSGTTLAAS